MRVGDWVYWRVAAKPGAANGWPTWIPCRIVQLGARVAKVSFWRRDQGEEFRRHVKVADLRVEVDWNEDGGGG